MKAIYLFIILCSLVACAPLNTPLPDMPEPAPSQLATRQLEIVAPVAFSPTAFSPAAFTPTQTPLRCFRLIHPENDAGLSSVERVEFAWESQAGANFYILTFIYPNGLTVDFKTSDTVLVRYIETMPKSGDYKWGVTAYASNENQICNSDVFAFSKPESMLESKPKKPEDKSDVNEPPIVPSVSVPTPIVPPVPAPTPTMP